jgi:hypothetical protein
MKGRVIGAIPIHNGRPPAPYFVFIKRTDTTDGEVLEALRVGGYVRIQSMEWRRYDYLAIGRDTHWTHVLDNFSYTHWHSRNFKDAVAEVGARHDVFSFSIGDSDRSFDLHLYRGGLVRHFFWEDPDYSGGRMKEEFGTPLECEDTISRGKDPWDGLLRVASALGIECDYRKISLRLHAPKLKGSIMKGNWDF